MSRKGKDPWVRIINVSDPVLHKKGYTLYKVTSRVFPKNSVEAASEVTVWKRYNDFKKLYKALSTIHQNLYLKDTFPPFAKARLFGRFDESVIEERRLSALQLLQFAATHPPLFTSQVFVKFFEGGYVADNCQLFSENELEESVLEPKKGLLQSHVLQPKIIDGDKSSENDVKDAVNSLGGTWQHRQIPDNISLGSHCTEDDEDDRTTFTDDDSIISRPSLNLSEFDPLFELNHNESQKDLHLSSQDNLCNSWLLSALQSCSNSNAEKDLEGVLEFPTPFGDLEGADMPLTPSRDITFINNENMAAHVEHFTFDVESSNGDNKLPDLEVFDPLYNGGSSTNTSEDNLENYDDFAMTPTAFKTSCKSRPSFVVLASKYVIHAQEAEETEKYIEAFDSYKKAIDILLQGIQRDNCSDLKDAIRKKVLLYLMRAEEIYENKLPKPEKLKHESINKVSNLQGCVEDLNKYKVLGILGSVLLVLDISSNSIYVVKTLYKCSSPKRLDTPNIIPQNIPFMVKLYQIYETSYAIFLILQHATGGRLWDYVSSFLNRPLSPCNDGICLYVESISKKELSNVYSGKKISESNDVSESLNSVDSDLTPSKNCSSSYIALFKHYAATTNKDENNALAKYHRYSRMSSVDAVPTAAKDSCNQKSSEQCDGVFSGESFGDANQATLVHSSNCQAQQIKNSRNRLSSSTGSLETAVSQKACIFEAFDAMDEVICQATSKPNHLPETCVCLWAAEIVVALESLHNLGITWMDFHPNNILLGAEGHILLTYQSQWNCVDHIINEPSKENLYCAPEVGNVFPVSVDCDWWSMGVIVYELLTGRSVASSHPTGITRHTILSFPSDISSDAKDFIKKLLQYNSTERLGSGIYGVEEIKSHPFFRTIDWESLYQ